MKKIKGAQEISPLSSVPLFRLQNARDRVQLKVLNFLGRTRRDPPSIFFLNNKQQLEDRDELDNDFGPGWQRIAESDRGAGRIFAFPVRIDVQVVVEIISLGDQIAPRWNHPSCQRNLATVVADVLWQFPSNSCVDCSDSPCGNSL